MSRTVRKFVSIAGTAASIYCGIRNNEWGQMVPSCHNVPTLVGVDHDVTSPSKLSVVHLIFMFSTMQFRNLNLFAIKHLDDS